MNIFAFQSNDTHKNTHRRKHTMRQLAWVLLFLFISADAQRWPGRFPATPSSRPPTSRSPPTRSPPSRPTPSRHPSRENLEGLVPLAERLSQFFKIKSSDAKKADIATFDGAFNDYNWILRGAKGGGLMRMFTEELKQNSLVPNPFLVSESLFKSKEAQWSVSGQNSMFVHFGLFVLNEILDTSKEQCPAKLNIVQFPETYYDSDASEELYHPASNHSHMMLNRAQEYYVEGPNHPTRKRNFRSAWIDGETIYGNSKFCSDRIRTFHNGKLIELKELDLRLLDHLQCFNRFSGHHIYENPFTAAILLVWMRWHNTIADVIAMNHRKLNDEQIFSEARKLTVASLQRVIYDEWLPVLLNGDEFSPYKGYKSTTNPQISDLFDAIMPLYHFTLVSPCVFKLNSDCSKHLPVRLCNSYGDTFHILINSGHEQLLNGLLLQSAQLNDHKIIEDIQRFAPGSLDISRVDGAALLLQQARDYSLPDYLTVRRKLGLDSTRYTSYDDFSKTWETALSNDVNLLEKIKRIYLVDGFSKIDFAVGALLENNGYGPGELIRYLIKEQFERIREADRFHYENALTGHFNAEQIEHIQKFRFVDILRMVSGVNEGFFHRGSNPFLLPIDREEVLKGNCMQLSEIFIDYVCRTINQDGSRRENCLSIDPKRDKSKVEPCTKGSTYDYFIGSENSFAITFMAVAVFIVCLLILRECLIRSKNTATERVRIRASKMRRMTINDNTLLCREWVNQNELYRQVEIVFDTPKRVLKVQLESGRQTQRYIFFKESSNEKVLIQVSQNKNQDHILVRFAHEYDLVMAFDSYYDRERFLANLETFLLELHVEHERVSQDLKFMLKNAYTREKRQAHLEQFFRVVFSHAFNKKLNQAMDVRTAKEIINTELTQFEFAEALSMTPTSTFAQQMFRLIDKDNNGYISFREFMDIMVIFAKGTPEQKIRIMFDMYDCNQNGRLSINDFRSMIKSLLEIADQTIPQIQMDQTIHSMLNEVGLASKRDLSFEDFTKLFDNNKERLGYTELSFDMSTISDKVGTTKRKSVLVRANDTIIRAISYFGDKAGPDFSKQAPSMLKIETQNQNKKDTKKTFAWVRFCEARTKEIFFIVLYTAIMFAIFFDKCYYYTYLNEKSGLRQIAGWGVTLTRGSASVIMFTFSTILITMCRNLITFLRETFLHRFIPFDSAVVMHKYIAFWAFVMTIIHVVGHAINFYNIGTQRPSYLNCLFKEVYFVNEQLPKFHHWAFGTITGISGILLLCILFVIYIFALQYSRRHIFNAFWWTHNLYPLFYILIVLHGLGKLIQPPIFYFYFAIPITLFTIDRLISVSRKKVEISVVRAVLHPSNVTHLEFKRPPNFDYKSGQWMRIACVELNSNEYHPFTIASAPHEETLSMYIRAVGPFTKNLRRIYDSTNLNGRPYPKLYLDGPYGEGHQDWLKYEVSVLVGGGIGTTPFASILKDCAIKQKIRCKKLYFLWVTRTQRQFEWMSDMIREAEEKDKNNLLQTHIFITQFYEKYDLRTTMLYICERHFQRISNKSLFTGLKAKTHFGRPNFEVFLDSLQLEHPHVESVGVFSCGLAPMTNNVQAACEKLNRKDGAMFIHHFENF